LPRYLTEAQIRQIEAEIMADEIADRAEALQLEAKARGFVIEMESVADVFSVVTVRPRNIHAGAERCMVPA